MQNTLSYHGVTRSPPVSVSLSPLIPSLLGAGGCLCYVCKPNPTELVEKGKMKLLPPYNWSIRQIADEVWGWDITYLLTTLKDSITISVRNMDK
jgi:hypothetical protein